MERESHYTRCRETFPPKQLFFLPSRHSRQSKSWRGYDSEISNSRPDSVWASCKNNEVAFIHRRGHVKASIAGPPQSATPSSPINRPDGEGRAAANRSGRDQSTSRDQDDDRRLNWAEVPNPASPSQRTHPDRSRSGGLLRAPLVTLDLTGWGRRGRRAVLSLGLIQIDAALDRVDPLIRGADFFCRC